MDWTSIAGVVAPAAPKLGALLGSAFGPAGSVVGAVVGRAIAGIFGVEATPEAVGLAIAKDKNAVEKLRILENTKVQQIIAEAQVAVEKVKLAGVEAESIGVTQRAEVAAGVSWWHWRHLLGYNTLIFGLIFAAGSARVMLGYGDSAQLAALITAITPVFLALCALNGYVAADTTNRINTAIVGEHSAGGVMNTLRGLVAKGA